MHTCVRAIYDVNVTPIVDFNVVGLNCDFTALLSTAIAHATLVRILRDRRNIEADFLRSIRIANVDCAHAGIEVGHENQPLVINRCKTIH